MYPILDLRNRGKDLHLYLRQVEQVIIEALAHFGLDAHRIDGLTGVWVQGKKIAAVGVHASKWISMHGFAVNVSADLSAFDQIIPCGIADRGVCNIEQFVPDVTMQDVEKAVLEALGRVLDIQLDIQGEYQKNHD